MSAHPFHRETHPHIAAPLRRITVALAVVTGGLLAWASVVPAASASIIPIPPDGPYGPATTPGTPLMIPVGGMPGWQITVIALAAALVAATAAVILDRAWAGRRSASPTTR